MEKKTKSRAGKRGRLAAIDVGTNSIRCIVVESGGRGAFRVLDDEKATVRLGEGLAATASITPAAWLRAREALLRMGKIAEGLGAQAVEAVATSAVRRAENGEAFLEAMKKETGIAIRVISGEEEAELVTLSARRNFNMDKVNHSLVDVGGGSVEIVNVAGRVVDDIFSLDLGAVLLTERFLDRDPIPEKDFQRLAKHIRKQVRKHLKGSDFSPQILVGSGGTMTSIAGMVMAQRGERYDSAQGYEVLRSDVVHLLAMLRRKRLKERRAVPGLSPERADIVVAGVAVVDALMELLGANTLKVNERGIREGLVLRSLTRRGLLGKGGGGRDWRTAVEAFARSCHVDEKHARHVALLAVQIFDALPDVAGFDDRAREILEAAALLHDTGYLISYPKHHKHSYHLIRHADLYDFSPREKELIANVARYHRRALPKGGHENFATLAKGDRKLVRRLGGILRLADGLDRRRMQAVREVRCRAGKGKFRIRTVGQGDLSVEIYGGNVKGDLFEKAFGLRLSLRPEVLPYPRKAVTGGLIRAARAPGARRRSSEP